jgi:hypothetical protein
MRMTGPDADPNNFRPAFARKYPKTGERKKKRFPGNASEFCRKGFLNFGGDIAKKGKGEMHLARLEPAYAAQMWI